MRKKDKMEMIRKAIPDLMDNQYEIAFQILEKYIKFIKEYDEDIILSVDDDEAKIIMDTLTFSIRNISRIMKRNY